MQSFHNDPAIKDKFIARIKEHQRLDNLVQGSYWKGGKGCAVGCTLEISEDVHAQYPIQLGLPEWLARLEDHLFEALSIEEAKKFPLSFLEAIPVGISELQFDQVRDRFQIFWLERQKTQIDAAKYPSVTDAINGVIILLNEAVNGSEPNSAAWSAAWSAARSAAWSAAWSAARSAAESAAWSAARSAAESAAWSAARSAAWSAARSAAESAAESAARSAARSAAWSAARSAAWSAARSVAESAAWSAARSAAESAAESAARSAARSAAWSARSSEALVKRDWLLAELKSLN